MTTFFWPYDGNTVAIAGSFNDWRPQTLNKGPKGFYITIDLPPGNHQYKFVVDNRRWCYDVMRSFVVDDNGNRNNVVVVGGKQKQHQEQQQPQQQHQHQHQHQQQPQKEHKKEQKEEKPTEETAPAAKGKGKGQQQPKQTKQKQTKKPKHEDDEGEGEGEAEDEATRSKRVSDIAKNIISTVKSYQVPFYVGDVDCKDSVEDVLAVATHFQTELPSIGCMFLSGGVASFIVAAVVPPEKITYITAVEWVTAALSVVPNPPNPTGSDSFAHAVVAADPDKGIFPIKLKDLSRGPTFGLMRKRGLVQEEESDDEMYFLE
eukprot:TRINITY_DN170_c0_g1_i6.p1 TRINITY_DN170_c0_g1~~TRINITY_DN170_c0_g1_i6.p1  ORF type:complete len:317 (-),score=102.63 TRINITY_DN170_c0_g1_i6:57-1007(-)